MKPIVSLVKYSSSPDSLKNAIELCGGFSELKKDSKVLIKPNLVAWDSMFKIAPYGVFTTTRLVEDLIILLKEYGCTDISVGEGSVVITEGVGTMAAMKGLGYEELAKKYGVTLVDFNSSRAVSFAPEKGITLNVAQEAVEADFLINFPVLKTHGQSKVSLGLKNLKGCLKTSSKKLCHHAKFGLEYCFSYIADYAKPALTIVDGIYALERGALHYGNAYRKDVIVASRDALGADIVAAKSIGYNPEDITHFTEFAKRRGAPLEIGAYDIRGELLEENITPLKWDWMWTADNTGPGAFAKMGISGIALPKYDETLCSGCSPIANMVNILAMSAFKGEPLPKIEVLNGKKMQGRPGYEKTILLGSCIIRANEGNADIKEAVKVKGCPPEGKDVIAALKDSGLEVNELVYLGYLKQQSEKYDGKDGYSWDFYGS